MTALRKVCGGLSSHALPPCGDFHQRDLPRSVGASVDGAPEVCRNISVGFKKEAAGPTNVGLARSGPKIGRTISLMKRWSDSEDGGAWLALATPARDVTSASLNDLMGRMAAAGLSGHARATRPQNTARLSTEGRNKKGEE